MLSIFEKNMVSLAKINLGLAEALTQIKANERYEVFVGKTATEINFFDKHNNFTPLYEQQPSQALVDTMNALGEQCSYPYLYFFGTGNGLLYKVLLQEFSQIKKIFIFEPSLEVLVITLTLIDFSEEMDAQKILFIDANSFDFDNANYIFQDFNLLLYAKLYTLNIHSKYYDSFSEESLRVNALLIKALEHSIFILGNCAVDSLIGLKHHLFNISRMIQTPTLDQLVNKGKNSEILVIASTGPSLTKQIPLLKKIQKHVTIVCPDASFPILSQSGITPDIVFTIERVQATSKFYKNTPRKYHKKPIFAMTSIVHQELIDSIKSDNIQISIRPFPYLARFKTPSWGYLGFGMSASNMAFEFGLLAHFKYCVLVGQNLSFGEDGASHANGHVFGLSNVAEGGETVLLDAYGGSGQVVSTPVWKAFLTYFEQDIRGSKTFMPTFNCTEGGARIDGAIEIPFRDFIEQYVDFSHQKQTIVLKKPSLKEIAKATREYQKQHAMMLKYIHTKKVKIEFLFSEIMKFLEKVEMHYRKGQLEKINFKKVNSLLDKLEKIKSFFKEPLFESVVFDFLKSYIISQELEIAKLQVRRVNNEDEEKAKKIEWLYIHRYWLFSLAGGMEAILDVLKQAPTHVDA